MDLNLTQGALNLTQGGPLDSGQWFSFLALLLAKSLILKLLLTLNSFLTCLLNLRIWFHNFGNESLCAYIYNNAYSYHILIQSI